MQRIDRRTVLATAVPAALLAGFGASDAAASRANLNFGPARPFGFQTLVARAKSLAASAYAAPQPPAAEVLQAIDFDASQKIKFRKECALWRQDTYPVRFFHLNRIVNLPVRIHAVAGKFAREILYASACFDYGNIGLGQKLPANLGFSGFRIMNGPNAESDWLAFQGASYFRASGAEDQYGASARGIAVDTALSTTEEFPRFSEFYLGGAPDSGVVVHALLEGPSLTGAYRFECRRANGVTMDVHAELFFRADVTRLGIAPLTSMYWYGENERRKAIDWRPEIHDSDGLALWTGKGERIWRPLVDPPSLQTNSFVDVNPKGFGLLQRDRDFNNYQDDGAFYNRRPSIWIEPKGNWGAGAVQLVEIPTDDEIHDNIVAYWKPDAPVKPGDKLTLDYRLYWRNEEPVPSPVARSVATRIGLGGIPGRPPPKNQWKFVVDFEGGPLEAMAARFDLTPVVTLSRGKLVNPYAIRIVGTNRWRTFFDVALEGSEPLDLRCYLKLGDRTLTETWLYQFFPPA